MQLGALHRASCQGAPIAHPHSIVKVGNWPHRPAVASLAP